MARLTVATVRALSEPGRYSDGGTLFMNVALGGSKSWIQRLTIHGKRRDIGLGGFPLVTLAEAREQAFENRRLARRGGDPLAARRRPKVPTFREAAERTFEANRGRWRSTKTSANWLQGMAKRVLPVIGDLPVDRIGREDVLRILTPIWTDRPEIARKLRSRIRAVLAWLALGERPDGCPAHTWKSRVPFTRCMVFLPPSLASHYEAPRPRDVKRARRDTRRSRPATTKIRAEKDRRPGARSETRKAGS